MQWDTHYTVSRSLTIEIGAGGGLAARSSVSRPAQELALDALPVLLAFAGGATPRAALEGLRSDYDLEEDGFAAVVERLAEEAFLLPAPGSGAAAPLAAEGFASVLSHHTMLRDTLRVQAYERAISRHSRGRSVVEIGCGSGILSIFAARAGARRVVAIEESGIAGLAAEMFRANGCDGVVELRLANSRDVELAEPADLIIHEILGVDPFFENLLPCMRDARERLLRPGGRFLPYRLQVEVVGLELDERRPSQLAAEARQLEGLYGVDLGPLARLLAALDPQQIPRYLAESADFRQRPLSGELTIFDIDFNTGPLADAGDAREVRLPIREAGVLGGVAVSFRAHLDEEIQLTNNPFAPLTHWGRDVRGLSRRVPVAPGDEVALRLELRTERGRQKLHVDLA
jgi:protein arginine N-methyltransferase 1